jgi:hypothetical protein
MPKLLSPQAVRSLAVAPWLFLAACAAPSTSSVAPTRATAETPSAKGANSSAPGAAKDDAGAALRGDTTAKSDTLPEEEILSLVATSPEAPFAVAAFPNGAFIAMKSFLAIAVGPALYQDPALLVGMPEYANWDALSTVALPASPAPEKGELPKGAFISILAGNTHGVGGGFVWNGKRWAPGATPRDRRIAARWADPSVSVQSVELSTGEALLIEEGPDGLWSSAYLAGSTRPARASIPLAEPSYDGLAARSLDDAFLCASNGIAHFDGKTWSPVTLPHPLNPSSCAITGDGGLWVADGANVFHRTPSGEWRRVTLPARASPLSIAAAGARVWVVVMTQAGGNELWSTAPVAQAVEIEPESLPLTWDLTQHGITGLDAEVPDVPSLSADPAGPGTSACRALAVYLGRALTPEIRFAVAEVGEARPVIEARRLAKGRLAYVYVGGRSNAAFTPSARRLSSFALLPADYAQGKAIVQALGARSIPGLQPKLLCALPNVVRKLK